MKALTDHLIAEARARVQQDLLANHSEAILKHIGGMRLSWELERNAKSAIRTQLLAFSRDHRALADKWAAEDDGTAAKHQSTIPPNDPLPGRAAA